MKNINLVEGPCAMRCDKTEHEQFQAATKVKQGHFVRDGICVDPPLSRGTSQGKYGSRATGLVCVLVRLSER